MADELVGLLHETKNSTTTGFFLLTGPLLLSLNSPLTAVMVHAGITVNC